MNPINKILQFNLVNLSLVVSMGSFASKGLAQNTHTIPDTYITVMNYNIKGLDGLFGGNKKENIKRIMSEIEKKFQNGTAPDVLLFQEAFSGDANKLIKTINTPDLYPYRVKGPDSSGKLYNSGLVALSRFPILSNDVVEFKDQCSSWDCNADKGAQLVTIKADHWPEPIRILNTHLQATNDFDDIRKSQILILKSFYEKFESTKINTIFAGDFNTKPSRPSYDFFKQTFIGLKNVGEFCATNAACSIHPSINNDLLYVQSKDHQFFSCSANSAITPIGFVRNFSVEVDNLELSDHKAYQVQYKIDWNKKGCKP